MQASALDVLLVIFIALAALSLLGQWLVLLGIGRQVRSLSRSVAPILPSAEQAARALPGLVRDLQTVVGDVAPKLQSAASNLAEISSVARVQVRRADQFANEFAERLELQMVRVDEALGNALASVEQVTNVLRETVLRPVRDANALLQGVRTGLDFFFRRRSSPPLAPSYQDEEMFI